jgi:hypothetical protein
MNIEMLHKLFNCSFKSCASYGVLAPSHYVVLILSPL